jgi:hypothetical protein
MGYKISKDHALIFLEARDTSTFMVLPRFFIKSRQQEHEKIKIATPRVAAQWS